MALPRLPRRLRDPRGGRTTWRGCSVPYLAAAGLFDGIRSTGWLVAAIAISVVSVAGTVRAATAGYRRAALLANQEQVVVDDLSAVFTLHGSVDQAGWEALSPSVRRGLTFHDWMVTRGKYGTVIAACTRDGADRVTGVVSLDAPRGAQVAGRR